MCMCLEIYRTFFSFCFFCFLSLFFFFISQALDVFQGNTLASFRRGSVLACSLSPLSLSLFFFFFFFFFLFIHSSDYIPPLSLSHTSLLTSRTTALKSPSSTQLGSCWATSPSSTSSWLQKVLYNDFLPTPFLAFNQFIFANFALVLDKSKELR